MGSLALSLRGIVVAFNSTEVLRSVDLDCQFGELVVLTGPNGSGKTTLVNVACGLTRPRAGSIEVCGKRVERCWGPRSAFVVGVRRTFQVPRNWASLDLAENVMQGTRLTYDDATRRVVALLPRIPATRSPSELSLGQRRILEIERVLRSLSDGPHLLVMDEPLAGLDRGRAADVQAEVLKLVRKNLALLVIDHEPERWTDGRVVRLPERELS